MVPLVTTEDSQVHEPPPDPVDVAELAVDVETLLEERARLDVVSLLVGEAARRVQGSGSGGRTLPGPGQREQAGRPLPSLREVAAAAPEAPERARQPQAVIGRSVSDEP